MAKEEIKPEQATKPKPCCVCIPQKQSRDECYLINGSDSDKCKTILDEYKLCMKGYGFEVN